MSHPFHDLIQKLLEQTIRMIKRNAHAGAVVIVIVHRDGSPQSSACSSATYEQPTIAALRSLADKMEKTPPARMEMRKDIQN